jgi:lipoprotein-releasing system permease protein
MNDLVFLLTRRYLTSCTYEKNISIMVKICFLGIFLGSFALALITAITNGFEAEIHKKMQGIHAHAVIRSSTDNLNIEAIKPVLEKEFPEIIHLSPTNAGYVLVPSDNDMPNVLVIRAIDPLLEINVSSLAEKIIHSRNTPHSLIQCLEDNGLLVGKKFAQDNKKLVGAPIDLLFPDEESKETSSRISLCKMTSVIGGIFDTGIDEFDSSVAFCSFSFFNRLFPDAGISQINLKFHTNATDSVIIKKLRQRLSLPVYSWKELYPALVSALTLEKYVTFIIIALITLVASMNIMSLLFMEITNKRGDIAILRALGTSSRSIATIFMAMGLSIAALAAAVGIGCAYLISLLLDFYPFIQLPDAYYVSYLPVKMDWKIAIVVFMLVTVISLIASWLPTRRINNMNIATTLRAEG